MRIAWHRGHIELAHGPTGKHIGRLAKGRASDLKNGFLHLLRVVSPFAFGFFDHPVSAVLCWFMLFLPQIVNVSHV